MNQRQKTTQSRRGRIFPEIQWTPEKIAQWKAKQEEFYQRCRPIFEQIKSQLIETHYNWYMAVEPESKDYFIDKDELTVIQMARQKHPNYPVFIFRINETGIAGTL